MDLGPGTEDWRSFTTVVSSGRPASSKGHASVFVSWLESPVPSPLPPPRNFSRKAESVKLVSDKGIGLRPLEGVSKDRPNSAPVLDVDIDLSELGMREPLQRK